MLQHRSRRPISLVLVASLVVSTTMALLASQSSTVSAARSGATKYAVCHRTNAIKNPYRLINVAWSSVKQGGGHNKNPHAGPVFNVANPSGSHGTTPRDSGLGNDAGGGDDRWGDIYRAVNGSTVIEKNWDTAGQAIMNGAQFTLNNVTKAACRAMTPQEFIASEKEENPNISMVDIMKELDDQGAAEDAALLQSLGGVSFEAWYGTNGGGSNDVNQISSLITAESPSVTTEPPTSVNSTSATLKGTIAPSGSNMQWYFEWATSANDLNTSPNETTISTNAVTASQNVSTGIGQLTYNTTYYYRTVGVVTSGAGETLVETVLNGTVESFTTPNVQPPATTTEPATSITTTSATLNGTGTSNGASSDVVFKWGTDSTLSTGTANANATQNSLATNASGTAVSAALANLQPYTTYYFRTIITNTNGSAEGVIRSFTTLPVAPEVITDPATSVTETSATLNGTADPNMFSSDVEFTWSTSSTLATGTTTRQAIESPLSAGGNPLPVTLNLTGLTGGTTYYFRVTITNPNGTVQGLIRSFTTTAAAATPGVVPTPTTVAPTSTPTTVAPAPTSAPTTAPTTSVATAGTGEIGRVIGTAWFDTNKNNKRENSEPLLIGLTIELIPAGVTAKSSGRVRTAATSMLTGTDGSFDFTSVVPGSYRIQGKLPAGYGIDQSWDSTGNNDWTVGVTVVSAKVARGDFAAIGTAEMSGCYSGQTVARELAATWDGFDKKLGTVDDAAFTSSIGKDCNFAVEGVPTGKFAVAAVTETGKVVSKATVEVTPEGGVVKTASLSVKAVVPKVLPQTGSRQMSDLMMLAMYSIAAGAGIFMTSRRRRRL